jgi:hypothetical protein
MLAVLLNESLICMMKVSMSKSSSVSHAFHELVTVAAQQAMMLMCPQKQKSLRRHQSSLPSLVAVAIQLTAPKQPTAVLLLLLLLLVLTIMV